MILFNQITIQRTELNSPLGLELQLHITEAVCPALSEPGQWMVLSCYLANQLRCFEPHYITIILCEQDYELFFASLRDYMSV